MTLMLCIYVVVWCVGKYGIIKMIKLLELLWFSRSWQRCSLAKCSRSCSVFINIHKLMALVITARCIRGYYEYKNVWRSLKTIYVICHCQTKIPLLVVFNVLSGHFKNLHNFGHCTDFGIDTYGIWLKCTSETSTVTITLNCYWRFVYQYSMCISLSYDSAVSINYYTTDCISDTYVRSVKIEAGKYCTYIHTFFRDEKVHKHKNFNVDIIIM